MENLSYRHEIGKEPLKYLTIGHLAEIAASKYKDVVAIDSIEQRAQITFDEALKQADKFASGLRVLGMQKGDKLGLWVPCSIEWYVVHLACLRAGFLLVILNPANGISEMEHSINKVGIKIVVCRFEDKRNKFYDILMEISPELKNAERTTLASRKLPSLKGIVLILEKQMSGTYSYNEVMETGNQYQTNNSKALLVNINPDDACYIHFSSGTTGKSKAILLNHFQAVNNSYVMGKRVELDKQQHSICVNVPLFHCYGNINAVIASIHFGSTLIIPSAYYSGIKSMEAIIKKRCSIIYGTPSMYIDLINTKQINEKEFNIHCALVGGAGTSPALRKKMKSILNIKNIKFTYGLTETTAPIFTSIPNEEDINDTEGYIGDHIEIKVVDENGKIVQFGEPGEICVRGYIVMQEYYEDEESTKKAIQSGWLKTGDIGVLQSNGYARLVGRTGDLIIRGGENIYPKEIEDLLITHPSVMEVQVIGVPHVRLGEEVCACIKLNDGSQLTKSELIDFCKNKIAYFKIPTQLKIIQEFPKTLTGKLQRGALRQKICNDLEFQTTLSGSNQL